MKVLPEDFVKKVARTLQDEEVDVYVLNLYYLNHADLEYFNPEDRQEIQRIFQELIKDTRSHMELLKSIIEKMGK